MLLARRRSFRTVNLAPALGAPQCTHRGAADGAENPRDGDLDHFESAGTILAAGQVAIHASLRDQRCERAGHECADRHVSPAPASPLAHLHTRDASPRLRIRSALRAALNDDAIRAV